MQQPTEKPLKLCGIQLHVRNDEEKEGSRYAFSRWFQHHLDVSKSTFESLPKPCPQHLLTWLPLCFMLCVERVHLGIELCNHLEVEPCAGV